MLKAYARGFLLVIAATFLSINFYAKSTAFADPPRIKFALGPAGVDLEDSKTALIAVNLKNTSGKTAYKVEIRSIKLVSGKVTKPANFPFPVGDIGAEDHVLLQIAFNARTGFPPARVQSCWCGAATIQQPEASSWIPKILTSRSALE
jgi:hypothetical protein